MGDDKRPSGAGGLEPARDAELQIGPFRPAWWLSGRHLQTVWNRVFRRTEAVPMTRARWSTPDGDFMDMDFMDGPLSSPQLLVLHGLEGSSQRMYVRGLLTLAAEQGWRGVAMNFRSCSGAANRTPRLYHSGDSADLGWVIDELAKRDPGGPILPVGVSLGGNVVLKWLGEEGEAASDEVLAAVAISTPFDLAAAAERMSRGIGRIYSRFFLRTLKPKALRVARDYPGLLDAEAIRRARTLGEYDDAATAPLHGFEDAMDYWTRSSSMRFLDRIRRPVLLINAQDDPFIPAQTLPEDEVERSHWLQAEFTERGGHAGFVSGPRPWRPAYWAEQRAIEFLAGHVSRLRPPP